MWYNPSDAMQDIPTRPNLWHQYRHDVHLNGVLTCHEYPAHFEKANDVRRAAQNKEHLDYTPVQYSRTVREFVETSVRRNMAGAYQEEGWNLARAFSSWKKDQELRLRWIANGFR